MVTDRGEQQLTALEEIRGHIRDHKLGFIDPFEFVTAVFETMARWNGHDGGYPTPAKDIRPIDFSPSEQTIAPMTTPPVQPLSAFDDALEEYVKVRIAVAEQERTRYKTMDAAHCENLVTIYHHALLNTMKPAIAVCTEAEAREAFQVWWCPPDHDENPSFFSHKAFAKDAWFAAYRHAGLLIEE